MTIDEIEYQPRYIDIDCITSVRRPEIVGLVFVSRFTDALVLPALLELLVLGNLSFTF